MATEVCEQLCTSQGIEAARGLCLPSSVAALSKTPLEASFITMGSMAEVVQLAAISAMHSEIYLISRVVEDINLEADRGEL